MIKLETNETLILSGSQTRIILTKMLEFDPAEKAVDSYTGRKLDYSRGLFNNIPVMVDSTCTDIDLLEGLMKLSFEKDIDMYLVRVHRVFAKEEESGAYHLALQLPYGTLAGYIESERDEELFAQRRDGSYDVKEELKEMILRIAGAIGFLETEHFHMEETKLTEIYICGYRSYPSPRLLHGVKLGRDSGKCRKAYAKIVEDIFNLAGKTPSPDIKSLIRRFRGQKHVYWGAIKTHPAFLDHWEKVRLIRDAADISHNGNLRLDSKMTGWPAEPSFHNLADHVCNPQRSVPYNPKKFSSFVTLLHNTLSNYYEDGAVTHEIKVTKGCGNAVEFVRFVEEICPDLWIWPNDLSRSEKWGAETVGQS